MQAQPTLQKFSNKGCEKEDPASISIAIWEGEVCSHAILGQWLHSRAVQAWMVVWSPVVVIGHSSQEQLKPPPGTLHLSPRQRRCCSVTHTDTHSSYSYAPTQSDIHGTHVTERRLSLPLPVCRLKVNRRRPEQARTQLSEEYRCLYDCPPQRVRSHRSANLFRGE